MSAAGRGRPREPEDYYTTPSWAVRRLLDVWQPPRGGLWLEPSAGNGAIIRAVTAAGRDDLHWLAVELRDEEERALSSSGRAGCAYWIQNFLTFPFPASTFEQVDVVLGNPPYAHAEEFVHRARRLCPRAEIVYLLRIAFASSQERHPFMQANPPDLDVLPDRPSFTEGGGDSADYAWFHWPAAPRGTGSIRVLNLTPLEERKRDRGHRVMIEPPQRELFG